jgi:hypothetical protein
MKELPDMPLQRCFDHFGYVVLGFHLPVEKGFVFTSIGANGFKAIDTKAVVIGPATHEEYVEQHEWLAHGLMYRPQSYYYKVVAE